MSCARTQNCPTDVVTHARHRSPELLPLALPDREPTLTSGLKATTRECQGREAEHQAAAGTQNTRPGLGEVPSACSSLVSGSAILIRRHRHSGESCERPHSCSFSAKLQDFAPRKFSCILFTSIFLSSCCLNCHSQVFRVLLLHRNCFPTR